MEKLARPQLDDLDALEDYIAHERQRRASAPLNYAVSSNLRGLMSARGLSQTRIAQILGEQQPWVSKKIHAVVPLTVDELERFAEALGVPVIDLLPERAKTRPTDGYVPRYIARSALGLAA